MQLDRKYLTELARIYQQMQRIRAFEAQANELYLSGKMPGLTHMSSGQEASAVGVCMALQENDYITSTHRGHGHCIAKGAQFKPMFCELLGKQEGYCRGKGGSMHIADQNHGNLGANAIVGGSAGIATGAAFSAKYLKTNSVCVCFIGDGALGQGLLYEVMNIAALWKLPVIYACENNLYGEYTSVDEMAAGEILDRPKAFAIPAESVDGQNVLAVIESATAMVEKARAGGGPGFLLLNTYRYFGHHVGDINRSYYRSKEEEKHWKSHRDPIALFADQLIAKDLFTAAQLEVFDQEIANSVQEAVEYALNAAYPDTDEVDIHVFAP